MLAMAGSVLLRSLLRQVPDLVVDVLLPRVSASATAAVTRSTAKLPAQAQGGGARTMAELQARRAKMLGEELKDYGIHRRRRAVSKQAAERRNKVHNARVFAVGAMASTLAAVGIYKARGGDAAPSV